MGSIILTAVRLSTQYYSFIRDLLVFLALLGYREVVDFQ